MGFADRTSPTGSIYDLGYRHYAGPRLGRRHAIAALVRHTLRSCYGIGRGGRAKIAPITLGGIAIIPAVIALGVIGLASQAGAGEALADASPIRYDTYYSFVGTIITLFVAAQAPELVGRDQRHGVLALYFSRALRRFDYALAKVGGLFAALLVLLLIPQTLLFLGHLLSSSDLVGAFGDNVGDIPPILAQGALIAAVEGSLALAIAAFTPRRAYATIAIIAAFVIPSIVAAVATEYVTRDASRWLLLTSVGDVLDGTNAFLFGGQSGNEAVALSGFGSEVFLGAALVAIAVSVGVLVRRYQSIDA